MTDRAEELLAAALTGDCVPLTDAYRATPALRPALMRLLLQAQADGPVAACFAVLWQEIRADLPEPALGQLRWYLRGEAGTPHPARQAVHRDVLTRFLSLASLPPRGTGEDLAFVAIRVAADLSAPLSLQACADDLLRRIMARCWADPGPVSAPMLYAALGVVNLGLLRRMADRALAAPRGADLQRALDWALNMLLGFQGIDPWMEACIAAEYARDPANPAAVHRHAQGVLHRGGRIQDCLPAILAMRQDPGDPMARQALLYAYWQAAAVEYFQGTAALAPRIQALDPGWSALAPATIGSTAFVPAEPPPGSDLAALLAHGLALAAVDLDHGSADTAQVLAGRLDRLVQAVAQAPVPKDWSLARFVEAAERLRNLDEREFLWVAHFLDTPHAQGRPEYGRMDLARLAVLHHGITAVAALCRAGIDWALAGGRFASAWGLARLIQLHAALANRMDQPQLTLDLVDRLAPVPLLGDLCALARDDALLQMGRAEPDAPGSEQVGRQGTSVHPLMDRAAWSRAESVVWSDLVVDPKVQGRFDLVWPDGSLQGFDHATAARPIRTARLSGAVLVTEGLLMGPGGHVLRPHPYHTSLDYPRPGPVVVAGQGRALRLRPGPEIPVEAPVLVLDAMAALHWPNYYHWMIPHLARIALAQERGLLSDRKLVLPQGLRPWMEETLALIGLGAGDRIDLPPDQGLRLDDALVMTSIEHLSPAAIGALRRRLMGDAAQMAAPPPEGPVLYLSRRDRARRRLVNEPEIEALARDMGLQVIAPEDYSVAEQMRLFAGARGIAAPEGAALTNTIFAAPGTRILSMVCVNEMMPIYNDLALVLGHDHRKLAGPPAAQQAGGNRIQPEFTLDPDIVRASLAWVLSGPDAKVTR